MTTTIRIKQGETLLLRIQGVDDAGNDIDLTNVGLEAQVRTTLGELVATLPIVKTIDTAVATVTESNTAGWPIGTHLMDFRAIIGATVAYSETVNMQIGWPVTA